MSDQDDSNDKEHEPSQKRLDQAREKGQIPKSTDLMTAASYAGLLLAAMAVGCTKPLTKTGQAAAVLLDQSDRLLGLDAVRGCVRRWAACYLALRRRRWPHFFCYPPVAVLLADHRATRDGLYSGQIDAKAFADLADRGGKEQIQSCRLVRVCKELRSNLFWWRLFWRFS